MPKVQSDFYTHTTQNSLYPSPDLVYGNNSQPHSLSLSIYLSRIHTHTHALVHLLKNRMWVALKSWTRQCDDFRMDAEKAKKKKNWQNSFSSNKEWVFFPYRWRGHCEILTYDPFLVWKNSSKTVIWWNLFYFS